MTAPPRRFRCGAFIAPFHRLGESPTLALERDLRLVELLETLDYDEAWFGEHHSGGWETVASPELMIAAAAARTRTIRLGTGVVSLPYHHPFTTAQRIVLLDHLTRGRLLFGVGSGALAEDAQMIGIDPAERGARFAEALDAVAALLRSSDPATRHGRGFTLDQAFLQLRPYQRPTPPLYVASSFAGDGLRLAAGYRAGLLLLGLGHAAIPRFRAAEAQIRADGLALDRSRVLLVLNVHVAESRRAALDAVRAGADAEQREYWEGVIRMPKPDYPPGEHLDRMLERGHLIAGSPGECIDALRGLIDGIGPIGGILISAREWADDAETRASYELFARHVAPELRGDLDGLRASASHGARFHPVASPPARVDAA